MTPKECMLNLMADVIGVDEKFGGDKLNDDDVWLQFMQEVFKRMDNIEDENIQDMLNSIDKEEFQEWIDDPTFWQEIDAEIVRRGNMVKTVLPSKCEGHC